MWEDARRAASRTAMFSNQPLVLHWPSAALTAHPPPGLAEFGQGGELDVGSGGQRQRDHLPWLNGLPKRCLDPMECVSNPKIREVRFTLLQPIEISNYGLV